MIAVGPIAVCRHVGIGDSKVGTHRRTRRLKRLAKQSPLKILGEHWVIPLLAPDLNEMARRRLSVQALRREVVHWPDGALDVAVRNPMAGAASRRVGYRDCRKEAP